MTRRMRFRYRTRRSRSSRPCRASRLTRAILLTTNGETHVSGYSRAKSMLDKAMIEIARQERGQDVEIPRWTLHDLRRSCVSGMARLGIALPVIEKVVNHSSGSFAGIVSACINGTVLPTRSAPHCRRGLISCERQSRSDRRMSFHYGRDMKKDKTIADTIKEIRRDYKYRTSSLGLLMGLVSCCCDRDSKRAYWTRA